MSLLRSEIVAEVWRQRYVSGVCDVAEMETGIERALAGECSDEEYKQLAMEHQFRQPIPASSTSAGGEI